MYAAPTSSIRLWQRFRRNLLAMSGLCWVLFSCFLGLFGYLLAPDFSPHANRIILENGGRAPGFQQRFLLIRKSDPPAATSWMERLVSGVPDRYEFLPIVSLHQEGSVVRVQKYVDEGLTEIRSYTIDQLAPELTETHTFFLGTDKYGRDILSRLILGTRVSLLVGLIAVLVSLSAGIVLGALAGYFGGRIDAMVLWLINVLWSMPTLLLVFTLTLLLGKGFWQVFVAVGLSLWVNVARQVRGQVLATKQLTYVEAARVLGFSHLRVLFRHVLPNLLGPVLILAASNFATAIVMEAGLSFLGVGVQPPQPSWGLMIREHYNFLLTNRPSLALAPGLAIFLLVLAFYLVGNGLRDALDIRNRD